ncbi:hypothetical protein TanjilG_23825 [Lupinus angustifolius]|uniref:Uncharacterized protein n=1 Tax=Lupinus angustifolius TaxID=3871 RepID=A0A4P1QVK7_LUPAN|nr:PREDICTED: uncharacterized protein LOC109330255 [Lupinus angustifolius]OIV95594.1 hypothetical protein TanjilG_23825 [Lupinus angustifolius]
MSKAADEALLWPLRNKSNNVVNNSDLFGFPSEFPYELGISSPVESVAESTETDSSTEEEEFFAALTRRLSQSSLHDSRKHHPITSPIITNKKTENVKLKKNDLATSPQSTLSGIGSWSGRSGSSGDGSPNGSSRVPSPLTTPFVEKNDPLEAIYAVAGEVARLKYINSETMSFNFQNRELGLPHATTMFPNYSSQMREEHVLKQQCGDSVWGRQQVKPNWLVQQQQLQVQNRGYESVKCTRPSLPQSAWPPLQVQPQNQRVQCTGSGSRPSGSAVKKGCGGTGVFLPRHHVNNPSETRKKPGFAPVLVPAKVVHALNVTSQSQFSNAFTLDYDTLLARRNALLMQKQRLSLRREEVASYETRLPQEWTY